MPVFNLLLLVTNFLQSYISDERSVLGGIFGARALTVTWSYESAYVHDIKFSLPRTPSAFAQNISQFPL